MKAQELKKVEKLVKMSETLKDLRIVYNSPELKSVFGGLVKVYNTEKNFKFLQATMLTEVKRLISKIEFESFKNKVVTNNLKSEKMKTKVENSVKSVNPKNDIYARIREITFMDNLTDNEKNLLIIGLLNSEKTVNNASAPIEKPENKQVEKSDFISKKPETKQVKQVIEKPAIKQETKQPEKPKSILGLFGFKSDKKQPEKPETKQAEKKNANVKTKTTKKPIEKKNNAGGGVVDTIKEIILACGKQKFSTDYICNELEKLTGDEHRVTVQTQLSRLNNTCPEDFDIQRIERGIYKNVA